MKINPTPTLTLPLKGRGKMVCIALKESEIPDVRS